MSDVTVRGHVGYVTVEVDSSDVLDKCDDDDLLAEVKSRRLQWTPDIKKADSKENKALELIYEEFRKRGDAPEVLREFLYDHLGRILP